MTIHDDWTAVAAALEAHESHGPKHHPDDERIAAWLDGRLAADDAATVREHVIQCPACRAVVGVAAAHVEVSGARPHGAVRRLMAMAAVLLIAIGAAWWLAVRDTPSDPATTVEHAVATLRAADGTLATFAPLSDTELMRREGPLERGGVRLLSPRETVLPAQPLMQWRPVPGATAYRLRLRDADGAVVLDRQTAKPRFDWERETGMLVRGATYVLLIEAETPAGSIEGSVAFRVMGPRAVAQYQAGLEAIQSARIAEPLRTVLAAEWAVRNDLWLEAAKLVPAGDGSVRAAAVRALIETRLGREP